MYHTLYALIREESPEEAEEGVRSELMENGLCYQSRYAFGSCDYIKIEPNSAHIITMEEYDLLLAKHEGETEVWENKRRGILQITDCDSEEIHPSVIGTKYIVAVACHK